jgi:phosphomannomutase
VERLKKVRGAIAGEGNGGVILPKINMTRDALVAAALIIQLMSERKQAISEIMGSYPKYFMMKKKLDVSSDRFEKKRGRLIKAFKGRVVTIDGLKIIAPDHWVHIRASNTEPLVRVICEGTSKARVLQSMKRVEKILRS